MDEYEKIRQRKREEYRKRHRAQVRRKQLINNAIVIGMIILIIATIIIVGALRGRKFKERFSISKIFKLILKSSQVQRKIQEPKSN